MGEPKGNEVLNFTAYNEAFARTYAQLVDGQIVKCAHSGTEHVPIRAPDAVIMDVSSDFVSVWFIFIKRGLSSSVFRD